MRKSIIVAMLTTALATAPLLAQQRADSGLREGAPDRHVVVQGDTLWSIAAKFLKDPWRWPDMWRLNKDEIKNPHLIYPGDVIVLDRSGPKPELMIEMGDTVKLSPHVRIEDTTKQAVPSIPPRVIEPFLSRPLVIEPDGLENAPHIVAAQADRVFLGAGDIAYARGIPGAKTDSVWQIYRPGKPLIDPETRTTLGYEAVFLGDSRVTREGDPATIKIIGAQQEIGAGDRLVAAGPLTLKNYAPHAPGASIHGMIIGTRGGLGETGPQNVVTLNRGQKDGLEPGHVLAISRLGRTIVETVKRNNVRDTSKIPWYNLTMDDIFKRSSSEKEAVKLPDERYGLVFVFRTFDHVSYALVMSAGRTVQLNDVVTSP